jgi:purine nucleoside phosphorylase
MSKVAILSDLPLYAGNMNTGEVYATAHGETPPIAPFVFSGGQALVCALSSSAALNADPRAVVQAFKDLGTTHLWLCESVGALSPLLEVGDWIVPDDYIDGTRGFHYTFFTEKAGGYVQQNPAFDPTSRDVLLHCIGLQAARPFRRGVYAAVSPTRYETPAEATFWTRAGAHIVGRFLSPYLALARELEMSIAALLMVSRVGGAAPAKDGAPTFERYAPILKAAVARIQSA